MMRNFGVFACLLLTLALLGHACASGEVVDGPATGTGNTTGQAGTTGTGNTTGQAGTTGTGNTTGKGGTTGTGNVTGQAGRGGTTGTGNVTGRGGTTGTGNVTGSAGTTGTGNTTGSAGTTGTGNTTGSAGVSGSAGSTGECPAAFSVSTNGFVQMPVKGGACWSGYPYTYADAGSTVMPAPMAAWTTNTLKMTGSLAAQSGTVYPYAGIGFSIGQTASGTPGLVTPTGTGLTFNFTNSTTGAGIALRAQVTNGTTTWCKDITTSPATILYSDFHVTCYNSPPGAAYAKEPIKGLELNLAGGTAAGTINLTITSITEN